MRQKYTPPTKPPRTDGRGRPVNPNTWCTGPDPITRDKYYAYLKHRCQAKHRQEDYQLTWEHWRDLWTNELWEQRGRKGHDLCLGRVDWKVGWLPTNVRVMTRREHFNLRKANMPNYLRHGA